MKRIHSFVLAAALLCASSPAAHGQPADPQRAAVAQALFDQAIAAMGKKDFASACPKLEEVVRLVPEGIGAQISLAECYEGAGRLASAWTTYSLAAVAAAKAGQAAREQKAMQRRDALEPKLAQLTIEVPEAIKKLPGLDIRRNGMPVGPGQWGIALPVDRGVHTISATAAGKSAWEKTVTVESDGIALSVIVEGLSEIAAEPAATEVPPAKEPPAKEPPTAPPIAAATPLAPRKATVKPAPMNQSTSFGAQRIAGLALGGLGTVGIAFGSYYGLTAIAEKNASNEDGHCKEDNRCDEEGLRLRESAMRAANISTGLFIAGGVVLGAGVVVFATAPGEKPKTTGTRVSLSPLGLGISGTW